MWGGAIKFTINASGVYKHRPHALMTILLLYERKYLLLLEFLLLHVKTCLKRFE